MSRFWVVSEWPQISVPPFTGPSSASAAPGPTLPPIAAPPINVAVDFRKSLRFMIVLPSALRHGLWCRLAFLVPSLAGLFFTAPRPLRALRKAQPFALLRLTLSLGGEPGARSGDRQFPLQGPAKVQDHALLERAAPKRYALGNVEGPG